MNIYKVIDRVNSIENKYNPEHDIVAGGPRVTATDMDLLAIIKELISDIQALQVKVQQLESGDGESNELTNDIYRECCG